MKISFLSLVLKKRYCIFGGHWLFSIFLVLLLGLSTIITDTELLAGCSFEDNLYGVIGIYNSALIEGEIESAESNDITGTVGNTTVFGEYYAPTERRAVLFRMPEDGIIQSITIFHDEGSTGDMILAVYDDDGDVPGSRIAVTPQTTTNPIAGWQTIDLITPVHVESQARIWLAWIYEDMPGVRTAPSDSGWGRAKTVPPEYWDDVPRMPEEFGSCDVSADWTYSIYATYIPGGGTPDEDPPIPNPSEWAWPPSAISHTSVTMMAATATDPSGVQYYFEETSGNPGGSDSDWQENSTYTDYDLSPKTQYTYRVKTRDQSGLHNEGNWSDPASATTLEFGITCPIGDLDGNCTVDFADLRIFAEQWLDTPGGSANLDNEDGIDFDDFALLAGNWLEEGLTLVINEFMASNSETIADPQNEYNDWIEIYNASDITIDMGGMWLENAANQWQIPNDRPDETTIGPHGYLLIWADNDIGDSPGLHVGFKLDKNGEQIRLYAADGTTLIDSIIFEDQSRDISYGRYPDAYDDWFYMSEPTPGLPNAIGMAGAPYFSHPGGTFTVSFNLGLTAESPTAKIYYTTDGSEPDNTKTLYTGPFLIKGTQWVRARVYELRRAAGPIVSKVYIKLNPDVADFESNLPIVLIDSFGLNIDNAGRSFHPVTAVFINTDEVTGRAAITDPADWAGYGGMHKRGASTAGYPKRQYRFETWDEYGQDKDVSLLGLPSESDWIIHGPWSDRTLMRNYLMYTWSNLIGRYASRTIFVEVFTDYDDSPRGNAKIEWDSGLDGSGTDYRGVYVLMEKINRDDNRVDIETLEPGDNSEPEITGGYLLKKDWGGAGFDTDIYDDHLIYWDPESYELTSAQKNWIKSYFDEFERVLSGNMPGVTWNDPCDGYAAYIDVVSFVDHHILVELAKNVDGFVLSTYLFKDRGGKINMGPIWDYNGSLGGADYFCNYNYFGWLYEFSPACRNPYAGEYATFPADNARAYEWYWRLFEDDEFLLKYADRWFELRENEFTTGNMLADIDDNADLLTDNGAPDNPIDRNYARWDNLTDNLWPNYLDNGGEPAYPLTYEGYVQWMRDWLVNRLAWMDSAISSDYGDSPPIISLNGAAANRGGHADIGDSVSIAETSGGTIWYTLDGNDPHQPAASQGTTTTLVAENADKKVLVPIGPVSNNWKSATTFNDLAWTQCTGSPGGVGYERTTGYENLISLDLKEQMYSKNATCYIRIPFTLNVNPDDFNSMTLKVRYDDAFIAYLNGTEVERQNFTSTPTWNSRATTSHSDPDAVNFEDFNITDHIVDLQVGDNILAIHGLNQSTTGADMLISAELIAVTGVSNNDAIEYTGPITLTKSTHIKTRILNGNTWSTLNEAVFAVGPVPDNLRITEIMYHPQDLPASDPNAEFIELKNISAETINLNLVKFTNGIDFIFPDMDLGPGNYVVVVKDPTAFALRYPDFTGIIAGQYTGSLDNAGERIELQDALGRTILNFRFKDGWYQITDGNGFSLNIIDPANPDPNTWEYGRYWQPSSVKGGTPCSDDTGHVAAPGDIVINEVLSHSDGHPYDYDWIELHNTTGSSIDISGWFLSENDNNLIKYEIAAGTTIPANGYIVFTEENHFHNLSDPGCHTEFGLSEFGETVYLSSGSGGDLNGGFCISEDFDAAEPDVTFGRYTKSVQTGYDVDFIAMSGPTYESENTAGAKIGPIVISEIMYHPASNSYAEYIELHNITDNPVPLYDLSYPENTWKLTDEDGAIEYYLPPGISIPANGYLLLVKNKVAFNEEFSPAGGVQIFEWIAGRLSNAGEKVQISKPGEQEPDGFVPYIRLDRVNYSDGSHPENFYKLPGDPWPAAPDGTGKSLTRISMDAYGNDPNNWQSAEPAPGQ